MAPRWIGRPEGTTHRLVPAFSAKSSTGCVSLNVSFLPDARIPEACVAWPARTACAPAICANAGLADDLSRSNRSIVNATSAAVTGAPVLKRSPFRSVNTYVLRSRETFGKSAASSGTGREPAGSGLSASRIKLAQVAFSSGPPPTPDSRAASIEPIYVAGSATRNVPPARGAAGDKGAIANANVIASRTTAFPDILRDGLTAGRRFEGSVGTAGRRAPSSKDLRPASARA
jgi:hypothetical protein